MLRSTESSDEEKLSFSVLPVVPRCQLLHIFTIGRRMLSANKQATMRFVLTFWMEFAKSKLIHFTIR